MCGMTRPAVKLAAGVQGGHRLRASECSYEGRGRLRWTHRPLTAPEAIQLLAVVEALAVSMRARVEALARAEGVLAPLAPRAVYSAPVVVRRALCAPVRPARVL